MNKTEPHEKMKQAVKNRFQRLSEVSVVVEKENIVSRRDAAYHMGGYEMPDSTACAYYGNMRHKTAGC